MELLVKRYILQAVMDSVFSVVGRHPSAALTHACLRFNDGVLSLIGSNGSQTLSVNFDHIELSDFSECLLPDSVHRAVKQCNGDDVLISVSSEVIGVQSGRSKWEFRRELADYPQFNLSFSDIAYKIDRSQFKDALQICSKAITGSNIRPMFNYIHFNQNVMQGCNGSKLHRVELNGCMVPEMLIPADAVSEIQKQLRTVAEPAIRLSLTENSILLGFDRSVLSIVRHWSDYPDIDGVLVERVKTYKERLSFQKREVADSVKRVALAADQQTSFMRMSLYENSMEFASLDPYGNWSLDVVDVKWEGAKRVLGVNYKYLLDMLSVMPEETVNIYLGQGGESYLRFDSPGFLGVLTSLRNDINKAINDAIGESNND